MKTFIKYSILIFSLALLNGCVDLDTYPEGRDVTEEQKAETAALDPSKVEASVNGIFTQFSVYQATISSTVRHNDFGYASIMLSMDANGYDVISKDDGYNWYGNALTFDDRVYTSNETTIIWGSLYKQIYSTNNVIATIDSETTEPSAQYYLAQALATRSFDYWVLSQLFQFNYVGNEDKKCVPIITDENASSAGLDGVPRATVAEVYELIMKDINKAVELMEKTTMAPSDKRYVSKATTYGLRARYNLTMQKWADAAADAQKAIENAGNPYSRAAVSVPAFIDSRDASWMWGILIAESDRVVTSGIVNFPSHMGSLSYGYANFSGGRQINKKLYASIPNSDVRKGWWLDENKASANLNAEQAAYVASKSYIPHTQVKYAPYNNVVNNAVNASDIPLMRVEEMYLTRAEGLAMSGNTTGGKDVLESFVKTYRDPEYVCTATSASDLQTEIYRQRRIELWGEGLSWFDIMRLKVNIDRRGCGFLEASTIYNIPAGSDILLYRIPESEIQSNPLISEEDNNPSASKPTPVPDSN